MSLSLPISIGLDFNNFNAGAVCCASNAYVEYDLELVHNPTVLVTVLTLYHLFIRIIIYVVE